MRRSWLFLGVVVGLALAASGCGRSSEDAGQTGGSRTMSDEEFEAYLGDLLIVSTDDWPRTDFSRHTAKLIEFVRGGPGRDGIPAVDEPRLVTVQEADAWLDDAEPVIELSVGGEVRAYPLQIMVWHEIVNDAVAGVPVVVTFCPLCNTALAFDRRLEGEVLDFGVTGLLRNSDLVMYDRQTESWWQQFGGEAVVGELAGAELDPIPASIVAWDDFAARNPDAAVLSRETGAVRPYGSNPYPGYDDLASPPLFGTRNSSDDRIPLKERVVFVERGGEALVVPFSALSAAGSLTAELGGDVLEIRWLDGVRSAFGSADGPDGQIAGSAEVRLAGTGELVVHDTPFWFAVAAFRPDALVLAESLLDRPPPVDPSDPGEIARATARLAG